MSAELDESPDPGGTVDVTERSVPVRSIPCLVTTRATPATKRPHTGSTVAGSSRPSAATVTEPGTSRDRAVTLAPSIGVVATVAARSMATGRTNPEL